MLRQVAHSQSVPHKIVCRDDSGREACDLFNEAAEDDDKQLYGAAKRDHMIVCFRPNSNAFLLLSYDSPRDNLWQEKDGGGFQQPGTVDFLRFINGSANRAGESVSAVGQWVSTSRGDELVSRFQGTSLEPPAAKGRLIDNDRVEVDSSRVHVSNSYVKTFDDPRLLKTEYEFSLTISTNESVETSRPPGSTASPTPVTESA